MIHNCSFAAPGTAKRNETATVLVLGVFVLFRFEC
jgi:hypothetical protein